MSIGLSSDGARSRATASEKAKAVFSRVVSPLAANVSLLVNYGAEHFSGSAARRIRFINAAVLIADTVLLTSVVCTSLILAYNGHAFLTVGQLSIIMLIVGFAVAPLLHRFGELAAPLYLILFMFTLIFAALSQMGTAQGQHNAFILIGALAPLMFGPRWKGLAIGLVVLSFASYVVADANFPFIGNAILDRNAQLILALRYISIAVVIAILFLIVDYAFRVADRAEAALAREFDRSETLLKHMMPDPIAERLKNSPSAVIADKLDNVTILFVDIVDFTSRWSNVPPEVLVSFLNRIFSEFDLLTEKHGLEKIKTIGDAYMVAGGMPEQQAGNVFAVAEMALDILAAVERLCVELGERFAVRVGMHTGPAVAGVIGTRKLSYDVWGDTVSTAARLESHGMPGKIQVTRETMSALESRYEFERRGNLQIKGKGEMEVFYLLSKRAA